MKFFNLFKNLYLLSFLIVGQCFAASAPPSQKKLRIGFAMDTLKEERWQKDKELFSKALEKEGVEVLIQAANGNAARQVSQAENLLTQNIDLLVVVPADGVSAAKIVEAAHKQKIKVLSYDRLIKNSAVDMYISFDNEEVGRLQARYLLNRAPKGNYILIGGAPTDNNAQMFRKGQMEVLQPAIDRGDIKIYADQWAKDWQASEALRHVENALTKAKKDNVEIIAVVASNDGTAGGVIAALKQQKLEGKVFVSGQDADLAGCQRIIDGSQVMTVYKPIHLLAQEAAKIALKMARNEVIPTIKSVDNGKQSVPAILLTPIQVDIKNLSDTVIKDGFHARNQIYKNSQKG